MHLLFASRHDENNGELAVREDVGCGHARESKASLSMRNGLSRCCPGTVGGRRVLESATSLAPYLDHP